MSSRCQSSSSEFSDVYKFKSTLDRKALRLQRRSIDWKICRQEETNKRRNLNVSPLQEISSCNNSVVVDSYKDITPVKPRKKKDEVMKEALQERMQQLTKWKRERELKKKLEARAKKPLFKVAHITHKEIDLYTKNKKLRQQTNGPNIPSTTTKEITKVQPAKPVRNEHVKQEVQNPKSNPKTSKTETKMPTRTVKETVKVPPAKPVRNDRCKQDFKPPSTNVRVTRAQTVKSNTQTCTRSKPAKEERKVPAGTQSGSSKIGRKTKPVDGQEKFAKGKAENFDKVSLRRGASFAPEDFTFNVPNNVSVFEFKPLSPASSAKFLYPNSTATTSFWSTEPGRCSTPKSTNSESGDVFMPSSLVQHSPPKGRSLQRTPPSAMTTLVVDQQQSSDISCVTDKSTMKNATATKEINVKQRNKEKTLEVSMNVSVAENKQVKDLLNDSRRITRSQRRSLTSVTQENLSNCKQNSLSITSSTVSVLASTDATNCKPTESSEATNGKPMESSEATIGKPMESSETTNGEPIESSEVTDGKPMESSETTNGEPIESSEVTNGEPMESSEATNGKPAEGSEATNGEPMASSEASDGKPTESSEATNGKPTESSDSTTGKSKNSYETAYGKSVKSSEAGVNETGSVPCRLTRSVRRSLCLSVPDEALDKPSTPNSTKRRTRKSVATAAENAEKDNITVQNVDPLNLSTDMSTPRSDRRTRRTMSAVEHANFQLPDSNSLILSAKGSHKKRRKTQNDKSLIQPKSPEEWIDLLKSSPMIEMARKKKTPTASHSLPMLNFDMEVDEQDSLGDNPVKSLSFAGPTATTKSVDHETGNLTSTEPLCQLSSPKSFEDADKSVVQTAEKEEGNKETSPEIHDVKYFRKLVQSETDRLNDLSKKWEDVKTANSLLTEEVEGQIRTVVCQAQLLISSKFKQFKGLIDDCEFKRGERETTSMDLEGFWEMMYSQVLDVDAKFRGLDKLQANNWEEEKPQVQKKVVKKKANPKPVSKPVVKSKFSAFRAEMKKKSLLNNVETKVFDAGLFQVVSPVKSPRFHCAAGSPKPKATSDQVSVQKSTPSLTLSVNTGTIDSKETIVHTPTRKSYIPVNPSPLLRDTTPTVGKRESNRKVFSKAKRICSDVVEESLVVESSDENDENEADVFREEKASMQNTTPRIKKTPRRSIRSRKSVSFCEPEPSQSPEPSGEDWLRFLQPSDKRVSVAPKDFSVLDLLEENSSNSPTATDLTNRRSTSGKRRSSLKELPSSQRRRSSRKSTSYPSPVLEVNSSPGDVFSPEASCQGRLNGTPSQNSSGLETGKFSSLNIGFTPVRRKNKPDLLYTPPDALSVSTVNNNVPTATLISFTP